MRFDENHGADKNYEPNSYDGPQQSDEPLYGPLAVSDATGTYEWESREGDDFTQAGERCGVRRQRPARSRCARAAGASAPESGAVGPVMSFAHPARSTRV
jgi:catalase